MFLDASLTRSLRTSAGNSFCFSMQIDLVMAGGKGYETFGCVSTLRHFYEREQQAQLNTLLNVLQIKKLKNGFEHLGPRLLFILDNFSRSHS